MNRFIRLARLDRLIKEGAKKSDDLAALRSIFMQKYPGDRSAAGLAQQYYDRFIGKSDLNAPILTLDTLPQPLPNTIDGLKDLLRSVEVEKKKSKVEELSEAILKSYPNIDLKGFSEDHLAWIHKRYVEGKSEKDEVVHSIEDALPTLRRFTSVQNKWQSTPEFKTKVSNAGFGDISSVKNLSIDEMEKIISLDDSSLTVQVEGVEIKEGEYLGKFGEWNLWLPHTKETSVKIAGYNPVTYEPKTTWCTARTRGSNLFYNYIGRSDAPSFLFYIIKDNPQLDDDWLSLGYISRGSRLSPDFSGRMGGLSVNRDNKGLTEEDYQKILGDLWGQIRSRIEGEIENFKMEDGKYESPARSIVLELAKDVVKFKKEFAPKSNEEKKDFIKVIFNSDPSDDVKREIYKYLAKKDPNDFLNKHIKEAKRLGLFDSIKQALEALSKQDPSLFLAYYREEAKGLGLVDLQKQALEALVNQNPSLFLANYREEAKGLGLVDLQKQALEAYAKWNPKYFLNDYRKEAKDLGLVGLVKQTLEDLANRYPDIFLANYRGEAKELGLVDLQKPAFEALAKQNPKHFLNNYIEEAKELELFDLVKQALEAYAKDEPFSFLKYYREESNSLGFVDSIKIALESLEEYAKQSPNSFLFYHRDEAKSLGLIDLIKQTLKTLADRDPDSFLLYHKEEAKSLGLIDLIKQTLKKLADRDLNNFLKYYTEAKNLGLVDLQKQVLEALANQKPSLFLANYIEEAKDLGLFDLQRQAFETSAKQDPYYFLDYYREEAKELGFVDSIKIAFESLAKQNPDSFLYYYREEAQSLGLDPDELVGKQASLSNHLVKLSRALESIGMTKEASRVKNLLNIR